MFGKEKRKIQELENQIKLMTLEWDKEKEVYDELTKRKILEQKVKFILENIDLNVLKFTQHPLFNITKEDADEIAYLVKENLNKKKVQSIVYASVGYMDNTYLINVQLYKALERKTNENTTRLCDE